MALTDQLVSYWKFDESTGNAADAVGGNTLVNTSATYGPGQINNAVSPGELRITNGTQVGLSIGGDLSISCWAKFNSFAATGRYMSLAMMNAAIGIRNTGTQQVPTVRSVASNNVGGSTGISTGVWYHIVFVYTSSGSTWVSYFNTVSNAITGTNSGWNGSNDFVVGGNVNLVAGTVTQFDGAIDEMGFWSRVLTTTEIAQLYNSGIGVQYPFITGGGTLNMMGV